MNMITVLNVRYCNLPCGILVKIHFDNGSQKFMFQYHADYLRLDNSRPISLSMPKTDEPYYSDELFGFFDNMIAEGWLKKEQSKMLRIDESDHFLLLLNNGEDLPGAVTVSHDEELSNLLTSDFKI